MRLRKEKTIPYNNEVNNNILFPCKIWNFYMSHLQIDATESNQMNCE